MNWESFIILFGIIIIGYLPYKVIQRVYLQGLSSISNLLSFVLGVWFIVLSVFLIAMSYGKVPIDIGMSFFISTTVVWFFAPYLIRKMGRYPIRFIEALPKSFVIRFEPKTFYLKYFEVIFQQAKFLFLLAIVLGDLSVNEKILWFTLIVGFLHINNIFFVSKKEGLLFFIISIPMALVFSIMILNSMLLVTTSIHLWFYLLFYGRHWLKKYE